MVSGFNKTHRRKPTSIQKFLILAEVLVPINDFCRFPKTRSLTYSVVISEFQRVATKLHKIKANLPNHDVDVSLRYFQLASDLLKCSEVTTLKVKSQASPAYRSVYRQVYYASGRSFNNRSDCRHRGCHEGTSPTLPSFNLFNTETLDNSKENQKDLLKTLCDHYGISVNDSYEFQVTIAIPVVNPDDDHHHHHHWELFLWYGWPTKGI